MGTVYQPDPPYATQEGEIHAKAFDLLSTSGLGFATYKKTPMLKVMPADLPRLSVYLLRDRGDVDGDFASDPHFLVRVTLAISAAQEATDDEADLLWLERQTGLVKELLLATPSFQALFEGVSSYDRKLKWTMIGETMLAEYEIEMTFDFRYRYPPIVPDTLNTVNIQAQLADPTATPQPSLEIDNLNLVFAGANFAGAGGLTIDLS